MPDDLKNKIRYRQQAPPTPVQQKQGKVAYSSVNPFGGHQTVQREVVSYSTTDDEDDKEACDQFEKELDTATDTAYNHVISAPDLSNHENLDGYIGSWNRHFKKIASNNNSGSKVTPMRFGYAVESLATKLHYPKTPNGYQAHLQVLADGTRPDVVLSRNGKEVAWYDLTAEKSRGHILSKSEEWKKIPHVSEILYPSLTPSIIQQMITLKDVSEFKGVDPNRLQLLEKARIIFDRKKNERLHIICNELKPLLETKKVIPPKDNNYNDDSDSSEKDDDYYEFMSDDGSDDPRLLNPKLLIQNPVMQIMNKYFDLKLDILSKNKKNKPRQDSDIEDSPEVAKLRSAAPHIISAIGLNPDHFGFKSGGKMTGSSLIRMYDKNMPAMSEIIESLSQSLILNIDITQDMHENPTSGQLVVRISKNGGIKRKNNSPDRDVVKKSNIDED